MFGRTKDGSGGFRTGSAGGAGRSTAAPSTTSPQTAWGGHTKGYGHAPDADHLLRQVAQAQAALPQSNALPTEPSPGFARTRLFAVPILNGDSYDPLSEFFEYRVFDLDEASGVQLHFLDIGDANNDGPVFQGLQSAEERAEAERLGREFAASAHATGRTDNIRLRQMQRLAKLLRVDQDDIPCLVFMRPGASKALEVFPLESTWWATPSACRALSVALRAWLAGLDLSGAAPVGVQGDRLGATLSAALAKLTDDVNRSVLNGDPTTESFVFQRDGATWRLVYETKLATVVHGRGMDHLKVLLEAQGQEIAAWTLRTVGSELPQSQPGTGAPVIDEKARAICDARLRELEQLIQAAESSGDTEKKEEHEAEEAQIAGYLGRATGLRGRARRANDDTERTRKTVSKAIQRAMKRIRLAHPELGAHLEHSVVLGTSMMYRPEKPVPWRF